MTNLSFIFLFIQATIDYHSLLLSFYISFFCPSVLQTGWENEKLDTLSDIHLVAQLSVTAFICQNIKYRPHPKAALEGR